MISTSMDPPAREERDSCERTMGVGLTHPTSGQEEFFALGPLLPPAGTHRSIDERTMGVGLTIDTSAGRLKDVDISGEKLRSRPYPPASPGSFHRQKTIVA
jgi:hypothetical protein